MQIHVGRRDLHTGGTGVLSGGHQLLSDQLAVQAREQLKQAFGEHGFQGPQQGIQGGGCGSIKSTAEGFCNGAPHIAALHGRRETAANGPAQPTHQAVGGAGGQLTPGALQHPVFGLRFAALKIELGLSLRIAHRHGIALRLPPLPRLWHQSVAQCIHSAGQIRNALLKPLH